MGAMQTKKPTKAKHVGTAGSAVHKRAQAWLAANREALESSNACVEEHGLPLAHLLARIPKVGRDDGFARAKD